MDGIVEYPVIAQRLFVMNNFLSSNWMTFDSIDSLRTLNIIFIINFISNKCELIDMIIIDYD